MFSDTRYETSLNHVLNELIDLEAWIVALETEYTLSTLTDSPKTIKAFRKEIDATTKKYELAVSKAVDTYYGEIQWNYLNDDIALYKEAFKTGDILIAPVISSASEKIINQSIKFEKSFFHDVITELKNNANTDVDKLIKKYAKEAGVKGADPKKLRLALSRDLKNLQVNITSLNKNKTYHDLVSYSRMVMKQNANNCFMEVKNQISKDVGIDPKERKVIVSSHIGSRPSHSVWEGKVYLFSELPEKTGYGTMGGLLGISCRHKYFEWIDGISENNFEKYSSKENDRVYKAQQELRGIERNIRNYKQKESIDKAISGSSPYTKKVKEWQSRANTLCKEQNISRMYSREKI